MKSFIAEFNLSLQFPIDIHNVKSPTGMGNPDGLALLKASRSKQQRVYLNEKREALNTLAAFVNKVVS